MSSKKAILVVSFGTSYNENREKTIDAVEKCISENFKDWEVRRAFTSRMIIKKLKERDGLSIDYIDEAMQRLADDGFTDVIVQPTHIINGIEYDFVVENAEKFRNKFESLKIGRPLLTDSKDYLNVADAILYGVLRPAVDIGGNDTAIVLMGHGTDHYANSAYSQLQLVLELFVPDVFVTTVEGFPSYANTMRLMKGKGYRNVVIQPFMLVAGDHANNDMIGGEDSLKSALEHNGYKVFPVIKGLGEIEEFRQLFAEHVRDMIEDD